MLLNQVIVSDAVAIIGVLLVGLTNGYFGVVVFVHGSCYVEPQERETAGNMLVVSILVGVASGACLAMLFAI